jgi:phage replication-related protein YjqB (UPF0714/DUF867 family)
LADSYQSYSELIQLEREGITYSRIIELRQSPLIVIAIHGGGIEPGTTEIAQAIAGDTFSFYSFQGLERESNQRFHITSTQFDEPRCLELVQKADTAISIHGYNGKDRLVLIGGLNEILKARLLHTLNETGFPAQIAQAQFAGRDPSNICNRCSSGQGLQIEISEGLRKDMFQALNRRGRKIRTDVFQRFTSAIHSELLSYITQI